jgi:hypothetical protein
MDIADESSRSPLGNTSNSEKSMKIRKNKKKNGFFFKIMILIYLTLDLIWYRLNV